MDRNNVRRVYYVLIGLFIAVGAWRMYRWAYGLEDPSRMLMPFGFIALFTAVLIGETRRALYHSLFAIAVVLIITSLVSMLAGMPF